MDRRAFIRNTLRCAFAGAAFGALPLLDISALASPVQGKVRLARRQSSDIEELVSQTLSALGGMESFVRPGETVVIKPNIGWDRTPETAANTHPLVVRALIEHCLEAGAKSVDLFDRSCNDPRRCYVSSGIEEMVRGLKSDRVRISHMDRRAYREIAIRSGVELQRWPFYQPALDADRYINVPVAKHHGLSTLTLGLKNTMGVIGGNRGVLHRSLPEALADINTVVHSDLTVIDATRILVANGPQGGRLEDVREARTLIASPDIVAADSEATRLFDLEPHDLPMITVAARRGLGVMDPARVEQV
ncbi:cytoplasmic protein [Geoalkalibacter subterraneus]|uniref:Cytoplasmic protein n=1 Tax=Geoalkalibacter subterraneus TaxID=483547 RepID=A0A0B5FKY7_9BACT|nr:cytoplasmic protein [Geoalkalibacter subterraneus]